MDKSVVSSTFATLSIHPSVKHSLLIMIQSFDFIFDFRPDPAPSCVSEQLGRVCRPAASPKRVQVRHRLSSVENPSNIKYSQAQRSRQTGTSLLCHNMLSPLTCIFVRMSQALFSFCPVCLNLFQSLAGGFRNQSPHYEKVRDAHGGEEKECACRSEFLKHPRRELADQVGADP